MALQPDFKHRVGSQACGQEGNDSEKYTGVVPVPETDFLKEDT